MIKLFARKGTHLQAISDAELVAITGRALDAIGLPSLGHVMMRLRRQQDLIHVLFLAMNWDQRQQAKRMMNEDQQAELARVLEGEPNW